MDGDNSVVSHESGTSGGTSLCTLSVLTRTITDATKGINNIPFHSQHDPLRNGVISSVNLSSPSATTDITTSSTTNKNIPTEKVKWKLHNCTLLPNGSATNGQSFKENGAPPVNGSADGGDSSIKFAKTSPNASSGSGVAIAIKTNSSLSSLLLNGHYSTEAEVEKGSSVTELLNKGSNHIGNGPRNECENESEIPGSSASVGTTSAAGCGQVSLCDGGHNSTAVDKVEQAKGKSPVLTGLGSWKRSRYLSGNFSVSGDTMEGIVQCLVFLKAFSVCSFYILLLITYAYKYVGLVF